MGMPITVEIVGVGDTRLHDEVFACFEAVDRRFSTYKPDSEITAINEGRLDMQAASPEMAEILAFSEMTRRQTDGYFDVRTPSGGLDPSGIVKGWAILRTARLLLSRGAADFYVEAGGDIQSAGLNAQGEPWSVGIRNPFRPEEIVRIVYPRNRGVATSGSYVRGKHIYDPHAPGHEIEDIVGLTVVGPDILEADRFATAAFAMGAEGIYFIEELPGFEGYSIDRSGIATMTTGFEALTSP